MNFISYIKAKCFFIIFPLYLIVLTTGIAQTDTGKTVKPKAIDTAKFSKAIDKARELGEEAAKELAEKNKEKRINIIQLALIDELVKQENKVKDYFKKGIDTADINLEIRLLEEQFKIASEDLLNENSDFKTMRNLNTSVLLMREIETSLKENRKRVEAYLSDLQPYRDKIDSLQNDTLIYKFPKDSAMFMSYLDKLTKSAIQFGGTDSVLTSTIRRLHDFDNYMAALEGNIRTSIELMEARKQSIADNQYSRELDDLHVDVEEKEPLSEKLNYSFTKASLVLKYFVRNNLWRIYLVMFVFVILAYFIFKVKQRHKSSNVNDTLFSEMSVFRYPVVSSAFLSITILQFLFPQPPVIFSGMLWIFSSIMLAIILWMSFSGIQRAYWLYFIAATLATLIIDLFLKESKLERWLMLFLAVTGIVAGITALRKQVLKKDNKTFKVALISFALLLLTGSVITNLFGRYNLSKIYLTLCFFALLTAYLLYWASILFSQLMEVSAEVYSSKGNQNFRERVQRIQERIPVYLKYLLFTGWIILVARNLYSYDRLSNELIAFMEEETSIGSFTFSFEKLFLFVFIIFLSTLISKAVSLLADSADNSGSVRDKSGRKSSGLSNWMLLIRIGVISIGTLLAFAATGFPMDKVTIIIGSLGVGIGLGLQTIVNNLVSGILLAFEKPFQIGDYIEVTDVSGRIKEIGIRSSKISTAEGADIIIPNGDLLSKHVTNWTLRNSMKRSELSINIKYGSHLNDTVAILQKIMNNNERIEKSPLPEVLLNQFGSGSVEYRLLYWTHIEWANEVKSELIMAIEEEFKKAEIELG